MSDTAANGTQPRRPRAAKPPTTPPPAQSEVTWHREDVPRAVRPPARWHAEITVQDFRARVTLEPFYSQAWLWQVQFVTPSGDGMTLMGDSPTFEEAQQDAQAVVRLRAESRPMFLDRRPVDSVAAPTKSKPAKAPPLTDEGRRRVDYALRNPAALAALFNRLAEVKRAAAALAKAPGNTAAQEALRVVNYLTGDSAELPILDAGARRVSTDETPQ